MWSSRASVVNALTHLFKGLYNGEVMIALATQTPHDTGFQVIWQKQGAPKIMQNEEEFKGFKEAQEGTIDKNILIYSKDDVDCLLM